ncbi:MAG: hypothetical protein H0T43_01115 [Solirubrobacterales bacterium]|nr:hypothetical protein [Solirubrobacterales bacterium]
MARRAVAAGVTLLFVILLVVGVRGCLDSRQEQALKDYNRDVSGVVQKANENAAAFFEGLTAGGASSTDLQTQVNQLRVRAEGQTRQARDFDVPGEMEEAHDNLLLALTLVEGAIGEVAERLPGALASDANAAEEAVTQIAGQMQAFTAADVVYSQRTAALIQQVLDEKEIGGQTIQASTFQQNLGWLEPDTVAGRIGSESGGGGGGGGGARGEPAPGLHGHGLVSVAVGETSLQPGGAANRIGASSSLAFEVALINQGENEETDVRVRVRVSGAGEPITVQRTVDQTAPGADATVSVPLGQAPPIGTPVTITVQVRPVPGEKKTDNNTQEYTALFTRG